jgi:Mn2+/Fe2+ NRAMP family transporter
MSRTEPLPPVSTDPEPTAVAANHPVAAVQDEKAMLRALATKPWPARIGGYLKLSGPGWLQSALTLGGGSLTGSLYLGVLAGFGLLWLQPFAMILGIFSLAAIGYVTLTTGERPFRSINRHINPALGWLWLIASMAANMIWALPQYSLATAVIQQNLMPSAFGASGPLGDFNAKLLIVAILFVFSTAITWSYGSGHWGVRLYERILKVIVAAIVACFLGVVIKMAASSEGLDWGSLLRGFIPDFSTLFTPAASFRPMLDSLDASVRTYWSDLIIAKQRDVLMTAFATAVGINMTFLLPYSMLGRGWGREHRGLAIFDLCTGMFIPFFLATTCVVVAAAARFHGVPQPGLVVASTDGETATSKQKEEYDGLLKNRPAGSPEASEPERQLAAMLVTRDAQALAGSLDRLLGRQVAHVVFGLGVLGMALSTITLLMLVAGFVTCEVLDVPPTGWPLRLGSLFAATGVLGPFVFTGDAAFWLAVPMSILALTLLPIAYLTFLLMMNSERMLGASRPRGGKRLAINVVLGISTAIAFFASAWAIVAKIGFAGLAAIATAFLLVLLLGEGIRRKAMT